MVQENPEKRNNKPKRAPKRKVGITLDENLYELLVQDEAKNGRRLSWHVRTAILAHMERLGLFPAEKPAQEDQQ